MLVACTSGGLLGVVPLLNFPEGRCKEALHRPSLRPSLIGEVGCQTNAVKCEGFIAWNDQLRCGSAHLQFVEMFVQNSYGVVQFKMSQTPILTPMKLVLCLFLNSPLDVRNSQ